VIWSAIGHQPHLLGGFSPEAHARLVAVAGNWMSRTQPTRIISGMAAGWDMAVAEAADARGVPLTAALAWRGQGQDWPDQARQALQALLSRSEVHVCSETPSKGMWTDRDRWAMTQASGAVALWSGAEGGTASGVRRAEKQGKPVHNLWEDWQRLCATP